jgi:hypothetical protein
MGIVAICSSAGLYRPRGPGSGHTGGILEPVRPHAAILLLQLPHQTPQQRRPCTILLLDGTQFGIADTAAAIATAAATVGAQSQQSNLAAGDTARSQQQLL